MRGAVARVGAFLLLTGASALLVSACEAGPGDAASDRFEVVDSAGVALVLNGQVGPWGPDPLPVREALRIGVVEGEDPFQFAQISDVLAADGRIFVGNGLTGTVRVFDADGAFLREFGGRGQGPGEFVRIDELKLTGDGVAVIDWQRGGRATLFDTEGRLQESWAFTTPDGTRRPTPRHWTPQGWLGLLLERDRTFEPTPGEVMTTRQLVHRLDADGDGDGDPVLALPPRQLYPSPEVHAWDWPLFEPDTETTVDGVGRLFVSSGAPYRVDVYSPEGEHLRSVRRPYDSIPQGPDDVEAHLDLARDYFLGDAFEGGTDRGRQEFENYRDRVRRQATFPMHGYRAPIRSLLVSADGSFWVERIDHRPPAMVEFEWMFSHVLAELGLDEPTLWDLFDPEGRFLGQVELPGRFQPHQVEGNTVLGVERDDLAVEYVVRYAVQVPDEADED
jgi:hypothetical protein